ncbi:hypothetical protein [Sporosarcina sp. Te-1]|uniref:hypothetical protein n=1 Tax=Sporosarcina sp. Te-1 TaxID=2818390 RepID=UPI001A9D02FE|nr:hypothetical protein [Sporosarcina sp. Te-1]QTD43203.1 hypothetical protein J3U78_10885 [Sporosarcina sp. Te-1]
MGQIYMDFKFLDDEDMIPSGQAINALLDEMGVLSSKLKLQVEEELNYAKGEIVETSIREVSNQMTKQLTAIHFQQLSVSSSTLQYDMVYNAMGTQPITITYRIRKPDEVGI